MQTKIDSFGRIVIPKSIRERYGLIPGASIEFNPDDNEIVLKIIQTEERLVKEGDVLVYTGQFVGDINKIIDEAREDRVKHILGLDE